MQSVGRRGPGGGTHRGLRTVDGAPGLTGGLELPYRLWGRALAADTARGQRNEMTHDREVRARIDLTKGNAR